MKFTPDSSTITSNAGPINICLIHDTAVMHPIQYNSSMSMDEIVPYCQYVAVRLLSLILYKRHENLINVYQLKHLLI